jgi:outer membrane protein TolC
MEFSTRAAIAFVFVLAIARVVHGDPGEVRLAEVVAVAVRQNPDLARARIDVEAARAALLTTEGAEDTHVGVRAIGNRTRSASTDPLFPLIDSDEERVDVSASHVFSTGGKLSITASGDRLSNVSSQPNAEGNLVAAPVFHRYTAQLQLELVQPLLRGAGPEAFEAPIRQAARQRDAAALTQEAKARDFVVSLAQAYWQVAFSWRQLEIRKASLELAQRQLEYTEESIRAEKIAKSETLAVLQAIAVRKQDMIAGEQDLYERSLALRQLGGLEIGPDAIALKTEVLPEKVDAAALDVAAVLRVAFERSAELAALEATRHAAESGVAAADSAAKSRLDLNVSGGPIGADTTASNALSSAVGHPGYTVTAGLSFDHAIEQHGERGGQATARATLWQAKVAETDARARLAMRATRAVQRARAALASIALGNDAINLAEQNLTAEQTRFQFGKSTNFDVLRRLDELEQARLRQASAIADYLSAQADLDGLSGAILPRYGIVMP